MSPHVAAETNLSSLEGAANALNPLNNHSSPSLLHYLLLYLVCCVCVPAHVMVNM